MTVSEAEIANTAGIQHAFPCQQCGAQLQYKVGTDNLQCTHCGHQHAINLSTDPIHEYDFHSTLSHLPDGAPDQVQMTVKCPACSAEFEFDPHIHADECPFCGTKIIMDANAHRIIQPRALLPFKIDARQASDAYRKWLKRLWFAPNKLKKYARKDRSLNGVYVPYWTYDCRTYTRYSGRRGVIYQVAQKVRVVINGRPQMQTRMVNKIRWTPVSGTVGRSFDDVLIYATDSLPREMARELAPWDIHSLKPYQEEFLSGFQSEIYKLELDDGFNAAKQRMHPVIRQDIRHDIGGDQQQISQIDTQYSEISFKHILLPFWIAGFRFRDKTYQFLVNARSGEVQGDRPYSRLKIAMAVVGAGIILAVAATVFMQGDVRMSGNLNNLNLPWDRYSY